MFSNDLINFLEDDFTLISINVNRFFNDIKGKTIFVTGGTGFFGIWLQLSFIYMNRKDSLNAKMIILTRNKNKFLHKFPFLNGYGEISYIEGDITTFTFPSEDIHYIIHAATEASVNVNQFSPLEMFNTVVNGTKRVLDLAVFKKVISFLFTSSGAVYGSQNDIKENINESFFAGPDLTNPLSVYGEAKRMAEVLCTVYASNFGASIKVARGFAFVGPFLPLNTHFAIGNFINDILHNRNIEIRGDGKSVRSYLYAADLTIWLWIILLNGRNCTAYNVGSDQPISILALANLVISCSEEKRDYQISNFKVSYLGANFYVPSIEKARKELGLSVYTDLQSSIQKTIKFYKKFQQIKV